MVVLSKLQFPAELRANFKGELRVDEPMSRHTSWQVGGPAALFCVPEGNGDAELLADWLSGAPEISIAVVGLGSNLLVSDTGFAGLVIKTQRFQRELQLESEQRLHVRAGSGVPVRMLLAWAEREGMAGLEFLTGIPGTCGGAAVMNAGTHLGETSERLTALETVDLRQAVASRRWRIWSRAELEFEYRRNRSLGLDVLVTRTWWHVERSTPEAVSQVVQATLKRRKDSQPIEYPSCGSVFKNPKGTELKAWQVIEKLRLRGEVRGGAQISEKHANFIINRGGATCGDIEALMQLIQTRASDELGINMEAEVRKLPSR